MKIKDLHFYHNGNSLLITVDNGKNRSLKIGKIKRNFDGNFYIDSEHLEVGVGKKYTELSDAKLDAQIFFEKWVNGFFDTKKITEFKLKSTSESKKRFSVSGDVIISELLDKLNQMEKRIQHDFVIKEIVLWINEKYGKLD